MTNRTEMNEEMMAQVNGGRVTRYSTGRRTKVPADEPVEEVTAVGVEASEDDDSFWGWLWKSL